jgi:hypothetical protein
MWSLADGRTGVLMRLSGPYRHGSAGTDDARHVFGDSSRISEPRGGCDERDELAQQWLRERGFSRVEGRI